MTSTIIQNKCYECQSFDVIVDFGAGDIICRSCGVIITDHIIDESPEWNNYVQGQDKSRCSGAIDSKTSATFLRGGSKIQLERLESIQKKSNKKFGLNVATNGSITGQLKKMAELLRLTESTVEIAEILSRKVENLAAFKKSESLAAILYIACKKDNISRTIPEIAAIFNFEKKKVAKACKFLIPHLKLNLMELEVRGDHLVPKICGSLGVHMSACNTAKHIAMKTSELSLDDGINPNVIAASSTWLALICCDKAGVCLIDKGNDPVSRELVAETASITVNKMMKYFYVLYNQRMKLVPENLCKEMEINGTKLEALSIT